MGQVSYQVLNSVPINIFLIFASFFFLAFFIFIQPVVLMTLTKFLVIIDIFFIQNKILLFYRYPSS